MKFQALSKLDIPTLEEWFKDDVLQSIVGGFLPVDKQVFSILNTPEQAAWMVLLEGEAIGFVEWELEGRIAYAFVLFKKGARRKGFGLKAILAMEKLDFVDGVEKFTAFIEEKNTASKRCFSRAGYKLMEVDEGMERWEKTD